MIGLRDYRSQLAVVSQDIFLFDCTIAENISFSNPHASREEIRTVSRMTHCDEGIERLDQKYETVVGEIGVKLSGGQRQRLAIARVIINFIVVPGRTCSENAMALKNWKQPLNVLNTSLT